MKVAAVIFDLDGTVIDNEDEYGEAFRKVLKSLGKKVDKKFPHTSGIGVKENWLLLLSKYRIETKKTTEELARQTQDNYLALLDQVNFIKGFEEFIKELKDSNIKTALATSNAWWIVDEVSDQFNIENYFDSITTGEEVEFKKPDPELFLMAAQKLGLDPESCLVIEDSPAGVDAAHSAGMKVIGIARDSKHAKTLTRADMIINNYIQVTPEEISAL